MRGVLTDGALIYGGVCTGERGTLKPLMGFSTFGLFVGIYIYSVVGFYTFLGVKTFGVLIPDETLGCGSLVAFGILSVGV